MAKPPVPIAPAVSIQDVKERLSESEIALIFKGFEMDVSEIKAFDPENTRLLAGIRLNDAGKTSAWGVNYRLETQVELDPVTGAPKSDGWQISFFKNLLKWFNEAVKQAETDGSVRDWVRASAKVSCDFQWYCAEDSRDCNDWRLVFRNAKGEVLQWPE